MKSLPTTKTIRRAARASGFDGVADLARHIGRSRETVYQALAKPTEFGPTIAAIRKALR